MVFLSLQLFMPCKILATVGMKHGMSHCRTSTSRHWYPYPRRASTLPLPLLLAGSSAKAVRVKWPFAGVSSLLFACRGTSSRPDLRCQCGLSQY